MTFTGPEEPTVQEPILSSVESFIIVDIRSLMCYLVIHDQIFFCFVLEIDSDLNMTVVTYKDFFYSI